ncbi:MAG: sigma 54-interacting transcriptional regulator [Anaeromyxobacter sp.]
MLTLVEPDLELWERFQRGLPVAAGPDLAPLVERWKRSRALGASPGRPGAALDDRVLTTRWERLEPVLARAEALVAEASAVLSRRGFALILADADGVVLASHGTEVLGALSAGVVRGARWDEAARGTNGIGTALAEDGPVAVLGRAHFDRAAHGLACYAAPIRDADGRALAVLDLSGDMGNADPLMSVVVQGLAAAIESAARAGAWRGRLPRELVLPAGRLARPAPRAALPSGEDAFAALLGDDPALAEARERARRFARSTLPVLLLAETGTGKELLARSIHAASPRAAGPFVAVNCGALPAELLESELFGHGPGAFTGARARGQDGKLAAADGGTLFLDELAEMSPALQAALLRVLEDGTYARLGETEERRADFRLVCATCRDLPALVGSGAFRADLYYRLQGVQLSLPPVRARRDLPALAAGLLEGIAREEGRPEPRLSPAALERLAAHAWPGNVRELKTALRVALVEADGAPELLPEHLPAAGPAPVLATSPRPAGRRDAEAEALRRALDQSGGNLSAAARTLGVARSTLYRLMRRHGL